MNKRTEFLSLKNSIALENRLLFLRIGLSIIGTLILLFLMIFIFGRSLQSKATPSEPTSQVVEATFADGDDMLNYRPANYKDV